MHTMQETFLLLRCFLHKVVCKILRLSLYVFGLQETALGKLHFHKQQHRIGCFIALTHNSKIGKECSFLYSNTFHQTARRLIAGRTQLPDIAGFCRSWYTYMIFFLSAMLKLIDSADKHLSSQQSL